MLDISTINILEKYFKFDQLFDLLRYGLDMKKLHNDLSKLKKDTYEPNYRFIFLHYDTEYFLNDTGLITLNLQRILHDLDISNYFCLILTQQNIQDYLNKLSQFETTDLCGIASISNFLHKPLHDHVSPDLDLNTESITSHYISLNGVCRFHRRVLISLLKEKKLLDTGLVSYNAKGIN